MAADQKSEQNHLAYVRLRAPQQHGGALDVPDPAEVGDLFSTNVALRSGYGESLAIAASVARKNVFDAAVQYTRQYLPEVEPWSSELSVDRVVMAGHQPTLFHPGVWYKNFRLDALAQRFNALPINLVVDNDLLAAPVIGCPKPGNGGPASVKLLKIDQPTASLPHESRRILDEKLFAAFGHSAAKAIETAVTDPIIAQLWPEVMAAREVLGDRSMGRVLAAGRHRLEWQLGLRTLEVPVSHVAATVAFGSFAGGIIIDIENFQAIYNRVLLRYRKEHGIRSSSHPVPQLTREGQWWESPFWVWTASDPQRRALFVKTDDDHFHLSDLNQFQQTVAIGQFSQWWSDEVKSRNVCIAPRALTTTMFCRLLVSDLFIHGIGGAKYDQLTDQIISAFFGVRPPGYLTSTATFRLPMSGKRVTKQDISEQRQLLREYKLHPERHAPLSAETEALKEQKRLAIQTLKRGDDKKLAHQKIEAINQQLAATLTQKTATAEARLEELKSGLRDSQILHSREYSFALHRQSIIQQLKLLARR